MAIIKIKMNTWNRKGNRNTKFKRGLAPRESYVDWCPKTKRPILKEGSKKWKTYDISIPRATDVCYINEKKKMYEGLCFSSQREAHSFMEKHKEELQRLAASNPLFDHWSVMNVIKRFEPQSKVVYNKDIKED